MEKPVLAIDEELIEGCRRSDKDAQVGIYKKYARSVYNTCYRIAGNAADAEDIMQESFIEAFSKIDSYRGEGAFGGWLCRIAVNNAINHLRKYRNEVSREESFMDVADSESDEAEISENIFCRVEEIRTAIELLPASYRIIISLHLLEGYDHQEIAEILGATYGNVRTRYSRAKQRLLQIIVESRN